MKKWRGCCLHHSFSEIDTFQSIQEYHVHIKKWLDIGYHFIIDRNGEVIKGRSLSLGGCHGSKKFNPILLGICVLGNFDENRFPIIQKKALFELLKYLKLIFNFDPLYIKGHKEVRDKYTSCPGQHFPLLECKEIFTKKEVD